MGHRATKTKKTRVPRSRTAASTATTSTLKKLASALAEEAATRTLEVALQPVPVRVVELIEPFRHGQTYAIDEVAASFGMSKRQLAETAGFSSEAVHRAARATAPKTQSRIQEMLEIIARVVEWAGGKQQAMAWYRAEPLPSFGGRTAESLVKEGKAAAVRDYLDRVSLGGFA
jgi:Antitoxin Xre/MbcA/ParS C-terminal toxin-binding domain